MKFLLNQGGFLACYGSINYAVGLKSIDTALIIITGIGIMLIALALEGAMHMIEGNKNGKN